MKKILLVSAVCLVSIVSLLSGCINVPMDDIMQFSIFSFEVDPGVINPGQSANLSWVVFGAATVHIDNGVGNVALSGHQIIFPEQTTTYTLTAHNETQTRNATVTIIVRNISNESSNVSIVSFEVNPSIIDPGESARLSWVVTGATMICINNDIGNVNSSGTHLISPTETTTYTIIASNPVMCKQASVVIQVRE